MPRILFHGNFGSYSGGHGKIWNYFQHTLALDWDAFVYLTPNSRRDSSNPWMSVPERMVPVWHPESFDFLFLDGMDWTALGKDFQHPPRPVINLVQGIRHSFPDNPRYAFLSAPAHRICVSQPVADAIGATGRVNGPVTVIPAALDMPSALPVTTPVQIVIAGLKEPQLAQMLGQELLQRGLAVDVLDKPLPRHDYLGKVAAASVVVTLPLAAEGFYLPALEAMALGVPVVMCDCIGSRQYARNGHNCLQSEREPMALAHTVEQALQPEMAAHLRQHGKTTAALYTLETERIRFSNVLESVRTENR